MSYQDYQNGKYGGPASNTTEYYAGRDQRMLREAAETRAHFRAAQSITAPQPIRQTDGPYFYDPTPRSSSGNGSVSLPANPFDGWYDRPLLALMTLTVALAVSFAMIWPAFDAIGVPRLAAWLAGLSGHSGQSGETVEFFLRLIVLGYASFILSAWTKALPITLAVGVLLLAIGHSLVS